MNNIKKYIYDFVEGRVNAKDFITEIEKDPSVIAWMQSIVPPGKQMQIPVPANPGDPYRPYRTENVPYDVAYQIWIWCRNASVSSGFRKASLAHQLNVHGEIARLMAEAFPDDPPKPDPTLHDKFCFLLDVCPSYIGGSEVEESGILEEILNAVPKDLSKTAAKKWAKERIKELFHIKGRHYPYWIQEPEWPVFQGKPMEYVRTVRDSVEYQTHVFRDPHTGVERFVFDAH